LLEKYFASKKVDFPLSVGLQELLISGSAL